MLRLRAIGLAIVVGADEVIIHPLTEVDAPAMAWAKTPAQIVEISK